MLIALGGFAWTVRLRRQQAEPATLTDEDRARARALLDRPQSNDNNDKLTDSPA
jgi:cytochrome c-type biogenesis protein CcmH/NrfF